jgi:phasin family protein
MLTQEQVAETRKANLDLLSDLGNKTVESVGKLAALYTQATRATLADTFDLAQKSLSVKAPQDWFALQNCLAATLADKAQLYSRQAIDIMSVMQAEFAQIGKAQGEAYGRQMKSAVEEVARTAPAGSEATMTALDSAIAAANTLYETLQSSGQQAVEATRSNLEIAAAASKSARRAIGQSDW